MSVADIVILAVVAIAVVLAIRYLLRSNKNGCSDCGSASSCNAYTEGGSCRATADMLARAAAAVDKKK